MVATDVEPFLPRKHNTIPVLVQDLKVRNLLFHVPYCPVRHLELGFVQRVKKFPQFFIADHCYHLPSVAGAPIASLEANASYPLIP